MIMENVKTIVLVVVLIFLVSAAAIFGMLAGLKFAAWVFGVAL